MEKKTGAEKLLQPSTTTETCRKAIEQAVRESALAYQLAANSYTAGAYIECLTARDAIECLTARDALDYPSWIEAFEEWHGGR